MINAANFYHIILSSFILFFCCISHSTIDGERLLKTSDEIRNPGETYQMELTVENDETKSTFIVYLKGKDKTLIVTKEPAKDRGRNMLMLDRDFYAYIPNLKRSVRLPLSQRMSGQVANGDIARTRWYGDYNVKVEKETKTEVQLLLTGNRNNLTYQKIRLWVETTSAKPLRAEYLSINGDTILKKASFENYKQIEGKKRPSQITISDLNGKSSKIKIITMKQTTLSDSIFTERNMERQK